MVLTKKVYFTMSLRCAFGGRGGALRSPNIFEIAKEFVRKPTMLQEFATVLSVTFLIRVAGLIVKQHPTP